MRNVLGDIDGELLGELRSAGVGAISSFLVAEMVHSLGIDGIVGQGVDTVGNVVVSQIIDNIVSMAGGADNVGLFTNVGNVTAIGTAAASFLGGKLADQILSFDSFGGQIGSALGTAFGAWNAGAYLAVVGVNPATLVAAVVAVAFWKLVGGLIGSIFGGTPRSGADVLWDDAAYRFAVANIYSKHGGSKGAASSMATNVSNYLNAILELTGGSLLNPSQVEAGNYGMRKKDIVYRLDTAHTKDHVVMRWNGRDAVASAVKYGIYQAITDKDFKILGGNILPSELLLTIFLSQED